PLLDLSGVAAPPSFEGRSILEAISGSAPTTTTQLAYFEAMDASLTRNWAPLTGIVSGSYKFVDLPIPELYDVSADPGERTNLVSREPERARALEALLRGETARLAARAVGPSRVALDAEARQRLQALGYVASSAEPARRGYTDA